MADLVHSASLHLLRRAAEADKRSGLGAARLSALSVVVFRGPLTLGALASAERVRSPTMTGVVAGMERDGLVRRRPSEDDRRAVLVEATPAGRRLLDRARGARIDVVERALSDLSPAELDTLEEAARLLEERFGIPGRPWRPL
ncbi:MAG: MarR family transcriptional regulator [Actinomycetota bacterium]|nr:MarR family transcriptional regulator [Actinomycetota bacterium]